MIRIENLTSCVAMEIRTSLIMELGRDLLGRYMYDKNDNGEYMLPSERIDCLYKNLEFIDKYIDFIKPIEEEDRKNFLESEVYHHFGVRMAKIFEKMGIVKMKDFFNFTRKNILDIKGMSKKSKREIFIEFRNKGINLIEELKNEHINDKEA